MSLGPLSAIIDIGSNSVRLVVYNGPKRAPAVLFNEKVMAGLGAGLAETGRLSDSAMALSLTALRRFKMLVSEMSVSHLRVVATAAARDASNARAFLNDIAAIGLNVEVLSGDEEARAAGFGVISAIPEADGIVGDLGGGSLELIRIRNGAVHECVSLPLGVLRLRKIIAQGEAALEQHIGAALAEAGWENIAPEIPFFLVGGSWRTLARYHMRMIDYPLSILHHYEMPVSVCGEIIEHLSKVGVAQAKAMSSISSGRLPTLADAAAVLGIVTKKLRSSKLIVSAHGLREGLLYEALTTVERESDPLIAAARDEGAHQGRFAEHGDILNRWIAPLFENDSAELKRLRYAACLLGDVSWRANPDFRAERGVDMALHGNWVGIDARGRALIAQALFTGFGGGQSTPRILLPLAAADDFARAIQWGAAIRLGQRLSGGLAAPLTATTLTLSDNTVTLNIPHNIKDILGDVVERRHKNLATAMGVMAVVESV